MKNPSLYLERAALHPNLHPSRSFWLTYRNRTARRPKSGVYAEVVYRKCGERSTVERQSRTDRRTTNDGEWETTNRPIVRQNRQAATRRIERFGYAVEQYDLRWTPIFCTYDFEGGEYQSLVYMDLQQRNGTRGALRG